MLDFSREVAYFGLFFFENMGNRVCLGGDLQLGVFNVGVDLRRVQVLVPEDVLHRLDVHTAGEHHRRRRVAQLVGGVLAAVEPGGGQMLFDEVVHCRNADAVFLLGAKQRPIVRENDLLTLWQVRVDGVLAGLAEVDKALLVALADDPQPVRVDIGAVRG